MRVLGIDPGLDNTGYGVLKETKSGFDVIEAGVIRTSRKEGLERRLHKIYDALVSLIEETKPEVMVIEQLFAHYKHPSTAILMGHARGVVCLASSKYNLRLIGYLPTRIKKAVVGEGHADKKQVESMVKKTLNLQDVDLKSDVSDALAIALSYFYIETKGIIV